MRDARRLAAWHGFGTGRGSGATGADADADAAAAQSDDRTLHPLTTTSSSSEHDDSPSAARENRSRWEDDGVSGSRQGSDLARGAEKLDRKAFLGGGPRGGKVGAERLRETGRFEGVTGDMWVEGVEERCRARLGRWGDGGRGASNSCSSSRMDAGKGAWAWGRDGAESHVSSRGMSRPKGKGAAVLVAAMVGEEE